MSQSSFLHSAWPPQRPTIKQEPAQASLSNYPATVQLQGQFNFQHDELLASSSQSFQQGQQGQGQGQGQQQHYQHFQQQHNLIDYQDPTLSWIFHQQESNGNSNSVSASSSTTLSSSSQSISSSILSQASSIVPLTMPLSHVTQPHAQPHHQQQHAQHHHVQQGQQAQQPPLLAELQQTQYQHHVASSSPLAQATASPMITSSQAPPHSQVSTEADDQSPWDLHSVQVGSLSPEQNGDRRLSGMTNHSDDTGRINTNTNKSERQVYKTSAERRERNKASQRESRKRRQDRIDLLEQENAALRKSLAEARRRQNMPYNEEGGYVDTASTPRSADCIKFSGVLDHEYIDRLDADLEKDDLFEPQFNMLIGSRYPCAGGPLDEGASKVKLTGDGFRDLDSCSFGPNTVGDEEHHGSHEVARRSLSSEGMRKSTSSWEVALHRNNDILASMIPSVVVIPEFVLYRLCRFYFRLVLPYTTELGSGVVDLRSATLAPEFDDRPNAQEIVTQQGDRPGLPPNLMPTESQLRAGYHPVQVAVIPFPTMREKVMTILGTFQSFEKYGREDEDRYAGSDHDGGSSLESSNASIQNTAVAVQPDRSRIYSYTFDSKPSGSHKLVPAARAWLEEFFVHFVRGLRVWCPAGAWFDPDSFE
ncbi:hypothetical protein IE53DRAFT_365201, partial [Violaceomyces palustris]